MEPVKILDCDDIQWIMDEIMSYCSANNCSYEDIEYHIFKDGSTKVLHHTTANAVMPTDTPKLPSFSILKKHMQKEINEGMELDHLLSVYNAIKKLIKI